jgi:hypothetical protein
VGDGRAWRLDPWESNFPETACGATGGPFGIRLPQDPSVPESTGSTEAHDEAQRTDLSESDFPKTTGSGAAVGPWVALGEGELRHGSGRSPLVPKVPGGPWRASTSKGGSAKAPRPTCTMGGGEVGAQPVGFQLPPDLSHAICPLDLGLLSDTNKSLYAVPLEKPESSQKGSPPTISISSVLASSNKTVRQPESSTGIKIAQAVAAASSALRSRPEIHGETAVWSM